MTVPHPIPYQGSKRSLAPVILCYFPQSVHRLIEPFAGSAAVSLAAAQSGKASHFLLNDLNVSLMNLWWHIVHKPEMIASYYEKLWQMQQGRERVFYDWVRSRFNLTQRPYYLLYLLARCVKASVRYNANGEFNQSPDNRRKGRQPKSMRADILLASSLLKAKTIFTAVDYQRVLQDVTPADLVYLDPPYQGVCANRDPRYIQGIELNRFIESLRDLNTRHIAYILSYDGRTGAKIYGQPLPADLQLKRIELDAGRSSQSTLLGRHDRTYESLYLSPALVHRLDKPIILEVQRDFHQLALFADVV